MTKTSKRRIVVLVLMILVFSEHSKAASFIEDFDDGVLDSKLRSVLSPGFTMSLTGGELVIQKAFGTMNGGGGIATNFEVVGDFTATVDANRVDLTSFADMGLLSRHPVGSGQRLDIFFNDQTKIIGNFFVGPSQSTAIVNTTVSPVTFQIERVGQTITIGYFFEGGFVEVLSETGPHLAGPAVVELFLQQNNGFSDAHLGKFDNFEITADGFAPPVPALSTTALGALVGAIALATIGILRKSSVWRERR